MPTPISYRVQYLNKNDGRGGAMRQTAKLRTMKEAQARARELAAKGCKDISIITYA